MGHTVNWPAAITQMYAGTKPGCYPRFHGPAGPVAIEATERELEDEFPTDLRQVLFCTDGIEEVLAHETGDVAIGWLVWPVSRIISENQLLRGGHRGEIAQEMGDDFLAFASAGTDGILFGYGAPDDFVGHRAIVVWNPMQESLVSTGLHLEEFLRHWLSGNLKV